MDLEQENKELQRYIRELKQEIRSLSDQLHFLKSKDQQVTPDNPNQYKFLYWHETPKTSTRTIEDDVWEAYYKPLDYKEKGGENGY